MMRILIIIVLFLILVFAPVEWIAALRGRYDEYSAKNRQAQAEAWIRANEDSEYVRQFREAASPQSPEAEGGR